MGKITFCFCLKILELDDFHDKPSTWIYRKTLKGAWDFGSFLTENGSILIGNNDTGISPTIGGERHHNGSVMMPVRTVASHQSEGSIIKADCQAVCSSGDMGEHFLGGGNCSRAGSAVPAAAQRHVTTPSSFPPLTRALWAGVKTCAEGNHYTITHAQPFDQKQQRSSSLSPMVIHDLEQQPDEDSAGYTTLHLGATTSALISNAENQMYYCCTDLMMIPQPMNSSPVHQQVTSLDDSTDQTCEGNPNPPLYVNMSPLHPLSSPKMSYPLINPIYPSPCRSQPTVPHANNSPTEETIVRNCSTRQHSQAWKGFYVKIICPRVITLAVLRIFVWLVCPHIIAFGFCTYLYCRGNLYILLVYTVSFNNDN